MNMFSVVIPKKDHNIEIRVEKVEGQARPTFNLFYCDDPAGVMYCNEHNIWIYEPHGHEALLLNREEIEHLGKNISGKSA